MKKKIFVFSFLFFLAGLFAYDGPLSGEKKLFVLKTQWFDIIYPPDSNASAKILYENADRIYDEITSMYGITQKFRMPVVLAPGVEQFNAYWSSYPYNHIVLYDTASIEALNVFSETLLSTFRHELTHGVTYNHRSPFWYRVGQIFGDPINLVQLTITSGWAEGATVSSESFTGEGRLNDEFAMQMVKQAKIQGEFPEYADVQGASDLYPRGSFYYFNGAFADYLQKTYGMECYANFWYNCVNFQAFTAAGAFRKAFGCSLLNAWENFKINYYIPELTQSNSNEIANKNDGAVYGYLSASDKGLVFVDEKTGSVYYLEKNQLRNFAVEDFDKILPEKLFCLPNLSDAKISKDGHFIALDVTSEEGPVIKKTVKIYNLRNQAFMNLGETGLQESSILKEADDYYLICQSFVSQFNSLQIRKLNFSDNGNSLVSSQIVTEVKFPINTTVYSFTDLGNGNFAYIKKAGLQYSICISDLKGQVIKEIPAPKERMVIRYLSAEKRTDGNVEIAFSWTEPKSLPRFGKLSLDKDFSASNFYLQTVDFSGGVYWPILTEANEIFYIGSFYRNNKLFSGEIPGLLENIGAASAVDFVADEEKSNSSSVEKNGSQKENLFSESNSNSENPTPLAYNPMDYYKRGITVPFSIAETHSFNKDQSYSAVLPFGLTYISSNPWTTGMVQLSAGYGATFDSVGFDGIYSSGSDTSLFSYSVHGSTEFDRNFWKQACGSASASSAIPLGNQSYVMLTGSALFHYGRSSVFQTEKAISEENQSIYSEDKNYIYGTGSFSVGYSNIHKTGPGRYEKGGIKTAAILAYEYNGESFKTSEAFINGGNVGLSATAYIPQLIPISSPERFTVNLPTRINLNLFSSNQKVASFIEGYVNVNVGSFYSNALPVYNAACLQTETILFGYDVQKAVPIFSFIFINDFRISVAYTGGFSIPENLKDEKWRISHLKKYYDSIKNKEMEYSDYINLKVSLGLCPNIGGIARYNNKTYLYGQFTWLGGTLFEMDMGIDVNF